MRRLDAWLAEKIASAFAEDIRDYETIRTSLREGRARVLAPEGHVQMLRLEALRHPATFPLVATKDAPEPNVNRRWFRENAEPSNVGGC